MKKGKRGGVSGPMQGPKMEGEWKAQEPCLEPDLMGADILCLGELGLCKDCKGVFSGHRVR